VTVTFLAGHPLRPDHDRLETPKRAWLIGRYLRSGISSGTGTDESLRAITARIWLCA